MAKLFALICKHLTNVQTDQSQFNYYYFYAFILFQLCSELISHLHPLIFCHRSSLLNSAHIHFFAAQHAAAGIFGIAAREFLGMICLSFSPASNESERHY
jgi:hypothetical protein